MKNKNTLSNIGQGHTNNAYTCNYNTSLNTAFGDLLCRTQHTYPSQEDNAHSLVRFKVGSKVGHNCSDIKGMKETKAPKQVFKDSMLL